MSSSDSEQPVFMAGGGDAGEAMRAVDWAATPLGPPDTWSGALRTTVGTLLRSRHPMFLWWGPELIQLYNDAYRPSFGEGKHPAAMGQRGEDCWQEIWPIIWPQIEGVMERGAATYNEDQLVPILRNGRLEEVFWTYGYSPVIDDDDAIGGCLVVCTETTGRALAERRLASLHALAHRTAVAANMTAVVEATAGVLGDSAARDVMYAMFLVGPERRLSRTVGLSDQEASNLHELLASRFDHFSAGDPVTTLPAGLQLGNDVWPEPVDRVAVVPFGNRGGWIVFGLNPRLPFDGAYGDYLTQIASHLAVSEARVAAFRARLLVERERDSVLMQAPVATALLTGPDLEHQLVNPRYRDLAGRREVRGMPFFDAFPELVDTSLGKTVLDVYRSGERSTACEVTIPLASDDGGAALFYNLSIEPLRDPAGDVYGVMLVATDVTAQVTARKALEDGQADLLAASRAKDEFLAMLGHELRNPLSPILTALELMRMQDAGAGTRLREVIERQVNHLVTLVDDLLDVARITRGELALQRRRVSVDQIVRRGIEQASPLIEKRGHRLEVETVDETFVLGDATRLAQVVANLLTNAAKYTDEGGNIAVRAAREDGRAVLRVIDDGIGLVEDPERLFNAFHREKRSSAKGGLGLGLAIVKSLVEAHDGHVSLHSEGIGRGTEAMLSLPLQDGGASAGVSSPPSVTGPARRLLIVDDNEDAAELLAMALASRGHEVEVVNDGPSAMRLAPEFVPDVALLDLGMPVMDGFELAARLREVAGWKGVRLVAVTGYGQRSDRERTREAGFGAHLVKPVDIEQVVNTIRELSGAGSSPPPRD